MSCRLVNTNISLVNELSGTEAICAEYRNFRFPLHLHDTFVFQLIRKGADWCSGSDLIARKNELFVHFPFVPHTGGTTPDERQLIYQAIYPRASLVEELTGIVLGDLNVSGSFIIADPQIVRSAESFFGVSSFTNKATRRRFQTICHAIIEFAANKQQHESKVSGLVDAVEPIRRFLNENYDRDVSIDELSDRYCVSKYHLIRRFKRCFGITPRQYLISVRVAKSKALIRTGMPVTDVAFATGFSDQSHLTRQFKRINGYPPGKIKPRRLMNERSEVTG